jgi:hypothetical protein
MRIRLLALLAFVTLGPTVIAGSKATGAATWRHRRLHLQLEPAGLSHRYLRSQLHRGRGSRDLFRPLRREVARLFLRGAKQ